MCTAFRMMLHCCTRIMVRESDRTRAAGPVLSQAPCRWPDTRIYIVRLLLDHAKTKRNPSPLALQTKLNLVT